MGVPRLRRLVVLVCMRRQQWLVVSLGVHWQRWRLMKVADVGRRLAARMVTGAARPAGWVPCRVA
jgi:hypothetical protein